MTRRTFTVTLTDEQDAALRFVASANGQRPGTLVASAIQGWLDGYLDDPEVQEAARIKRRFQARQRLHLVKGASDG